MVKINPHFFQCEYCTINMQWQSHHFLINLTDEFLSDFHGKVSVRNYRSFQSINNLLNRWLVRRRKVMLLESTTEAPNFQVAKQANRLLLMIITIIIIIVSLRRATTIFTEVITMIQTQRSGICIRALHSHQSAFKELEVFSSDLLSVSREHLPLNAIFSHNN